MQFIKKNIKEVDLMIWLEMIWRETLSEHAALSDCSVLFN